MRKIVKEEITCDFCNIKISGNDYYFYEKLDICLGCVHHLIRRWHKDNKELCSCCKNKRNVRNVGGKTDGHNDCLIRDMRPCSKCNPQYDPTFEY
jgi:hypothetical protein